MYFEQINITDFRPIAEASIHFNRDLTVLVGENSSGKSDFIEAIRLLTEPLDGRRTRYLSREDLFRRPGAEMVQLTAPPTAAPPKIWPLSARDSPRRGERHLHPATTQGSPRTHRLDCRHRRRPQRPHPESPRAHPPRLPAGPTRRGPRPRQQHRHRRPTHHRKPDRQSRQRTPPDGVLNTREQLLADGYADKQPQAERGANGRWRARAGMGVQEHHA